MRFLRVAVLAFVGLLIIAPSWAAELLPGGKGKVIGRYIVVLHDGPDLPEAVFADHGLAASHVYRHALKGFAATIPDAALFRVLDDPRVKYVEPDGLAWAVRAEAAKPPGGSKAPGGSKGSEPPQQTPWGVDRVGGPIFGNSNTAWIIDTGIDLDHPDLNVDIARSANFVTQGKNSPDDGNGHGTHVAGTVGALDNAIDVVGVAPGAPVVAVRVLNNSGSGYISWVVAGVDYVTENASPGDAANMSLGASGHFQSLHDAVSNSADQGILYAIAAGNDGAHAGGSEPAHVEHVNVFTVSAIGSDDCLPWWSNWGNPPVDFAAPGVGIPSTKKGGGVETLSGTSMATPHVTGLLLFGTPVSSSGTACNDPDNNADPIAHN